MKSGLNTDAGPSGLEWNLLHGYAIRRMTFRCCIVVIFVIFAKSPTLIISEVEE